MSDQDNSDADADADADGDDPSHVDPDIPSERKTGSEGGKVLTPEELDISDSQYVEELDDEGRYVVSPGGGAPTPPQSRSETAADDTDPNSSPVDDEHEADTQAASRRAENAPRSPEVARSVLAEELARADARYGIDIVARFDGESVRHRAVSNDVVATFEGLVLWYARHITDDTPVDEVVAILLREADFGSEPLPNLAELLTDYELTPDDSIADLVAAIQEESRHDT